MQNLQLKGPDSTSYKTLWKATTKKPKNLQTKCQPIPMSRKLKSYDWGVPDNQAQIHKTRTVSQKGKKTEA